MARVWIYQADRFLSDAEQDEVNALTAEFVASWNAHGSPLAAQGYMRDKLFLILQVDEEQVMASGCSIDSSVRFIKGLEQQFAVNFFDRMKVSFVDASGDIRLVSRKEFEQLIADAVVTPETVVFNNLVQQAEELSTGWKVPLKDSWHSKVF